MVKSLQGWSARLQDWSPWQVRALEKERKIEHGEKANGGRQEEGEAWREINHCSKGSSSSHPPKHFPHSKKGSSAR